MRREYRERFPHHRLQRKPLVSDPGMHHCTCVTHVPWCMSGSLTRSGEENVPGIPGACATRDFSCLVRGPCNDPSIKTYWQQLNGTTGHNSELIRTGKIHHNYTFFDVIFNCGSSMNYVSINRILFEHDEISFEWCPFDRALKSRFKFDAFDTPLSTTLHHKR